MPHVVAAEEFVRTLGVTIRHVTADSTCTARDCGRYDKYNRIAYLCDSMCPGRSEAVMNALLARIS